MSNHHADMRRFSVLSADLQCVVCSEVERKRCSSNYSGRMGRLGVGEVGGAS